MHSCSGATRRKVPGRRIGSDRRAAADHSRYRLHVVDYLGATADEKQALWALVDEVVARLSADRAPAGFNIGVNVGPAAGQTVMHLHLHVIPRYTGDMADPRGGVRYVIPDKAKYWS